MYSPKEVLQNNVGLNLIFKILEFFNLTTLQQTKQTMAKFAKLYFSSIFHLRSMLRMRGEKKEATGK